MRHDVLVGLGCRKTRGALLRDGREAVVRGQRHICRTVKAKRLQRGQKRGEIVVGIADRRKRGRPVDPGNQAVEAVALVMLGAVWITRPKYQHERLAALFKEWQHRLSGHAYEIVLL